LAHFQAHKEFARERILARLAHWHAFYPYAYGRVAIRDQSSRWGSCSKKKNLNFNYRIAFLPEPLMDYVIVHELCHLQEFNHSKAFWDLVAQMIPDYINLRSELRRIAIRRLFVK
jgi:predicted metal-dependent hydrolase